MHDDEGHDQAEEDADTGEHETVADEDAGDVLLLSTEGHANADFADALGGRAVNQAINADDTNRQRTRTLWKWLFGWK